MTRLCFLLLSLFLWSACTRAPVGKKPVIEVNGQTLTAEQFAGELAFRLRDHDALSAKDPQLLKMTKDRIVQDFIVQALSSQWAKDNGLLVKAEDVDAEINKIRRGYPDDLTFRQTLAEQGLTFQSWKAKLEQSILQKMVVRKISQSIPEPTDTEISLYYKLHKVDFMEKESIEIRQIVLPTEEDAETILKALQHGRSMSSLIPEYSAQLMGVKNGGVLWVKRGESPVFDSAFKLKIGRRSPIMKSEYGYHIFEILGYKAPKAKPLADVREEIKTILMEKRQQTAYLAWMDEQIRKSHVFKDQDLINAMKVETRPE